MPDKHRPQQMYAQVVRLPDSAKKIISGDSRTDQRSGNKARRWQTVESPEDGVVGARRGVFQSKVACQQATFTRRFTLLFHRYVFATFGQPSLSHDLQLAFNRALGLLLPLAISAFV